MMGAEYGSYPALLTAETCLRLSRRSVDTLTDRVHNAIRVGDKVGAAAKRGVDVVQAFFAIEADAAEVDTTRRRMQLSGDEMRRPSAPLPDS